MEVLIYLTLGVILGIFIIFIKESLSKDLKQSQATFKPDKDNEEGVNQEDDDWEDGSSDSDQSEEDELRKESKKIALD